MTKETDRKRTKMPAPDEHLDWLDRLLPEGRGLCRPCINDGCEHGPTDPCPSEAGWCLTCTQNMGWNNAVMAMRARINFVQGGATPDEGDDEHEDWE